MSDYHTRRSAALALFVLALALLVTPIAVGSAGASAVPKAAETAKGR
jgi:hypothetical protein